MKMFRFVLLAALMVAALAFPQAASATTTQSSTSCNTSISSPRVCLAESSYMMNDKLSTNSSISNLQNLSHALSGSCVGVVQTGDSWNDCLSSVKWSIPSGKMACLYRDANYGHSALALYAGSGTINNLNDYGWNDKISSIRFRNTSDGCF